MKDLCCSIIISILLLSTGGCTSAPHNAEQEAIVDSGTFVAASGETVRAVYYQNQTVELTLFDGTRTTLSQAISASGSRYVQGPREWWEHHGEATYSISDKPVFVGKLQR